MISPGVDALEIDGGHAGVAVAELALDDVQRDALAGEFDRVRVTQLMRNEAAAHPGVCGAASERGARRWLTRRVRECVR
jgi:hypothetical protein